jgi:hypothetical protein
VRHFAEVLREKGYHQSADLMDALLARAENAEAERDRLLRAMSQISMVGLGPDPGSAQWQIDTARAIARAAREETKHD